MIAFALTLLAVMLGCGACFLALVGWAEESAIREARRRRATRLDHSPGGL